jgi:hypothetical protein
MTTPTLTEFLLARIAEDEAETEAAIQMRYPGLTIRRNPSRVLAECEAKRRIVEISSQQIAAADKRHPEQIERSFNAGAAFVAHNALLALAAVYSDHPDYDEAWRP